MEGLSVDQPDIDRLCLALTALQVVENVSVFGRNWLLGVGQNAEV